MEGEGQGSVCAAVGSDKGAKEVVEDKVRGAAAPKDEGEDIEGAVKDDTGGVGWREAQEAVEGKDGEEGAMADSPNANVDGDGDEGAAESMLVDEIFGDLEDHSSTGDEDDDRDGEEDHDENMEWVQSDGWGEEEEEEEAAEEASYGTPTRDLDQGEEEDFFASVDGGPFSPMEDHGAIEEDTKASHGAKAKEPRGSNSSETPDENMEDVASDGTPYVADASNVFSDPPPYGNGDPDRSQDLAGDYAPSAGHGMGEGEEDTSLGVEGIKAKGSGVGGTGSGLMRDPGASPSSSIVPRREKRKHESSGVRPLGGKGGSSGRRWKQWWEEE
ncbi:unnamed protein product, partial [Discosporangium mesarthrocarpum]